jgi:molecular chaperone DnaK
MKLGEAMYKSQQPGEGGPGAGGPDAGGGAAPGGEPGKKEDVVDAEFTEVDDDKKKSA